MISLALIGKSVDVSNFIAMVDEMLTAPMAEHGEDDCDKAHCSKNFDKRGPDRCWLVTDQGLPEGSAVLQRCAH